MWDEITQLRFASDATYAAIYGVGLLLIAGLAMWAETRRVKRKNPDKVGWVPWMTVFFIAAFIGAALVMLAIKGWVSGSG
jgi:hypothetical protein